MGRRRKSQVNCSPKMLEGEGGPLGPGGANGKEKEVGGGGRGRVSNIDKLETHLDSQQPPRSFYPPEVEWTNGQGDQDKNNCASSIASSGLDSPGRQVRKSTRLQLKEQQQNASPLKESPKVVQGKRKRGREVPEGGSEHSGASNVINLDLLKHEDEEEEQDQNKSPNGLGSKQVKPEEGVKTRARTGTTFVRIKDEPVSPSSEPEPVDPDLDLQVGIASLGEPIFNSNTAEAETGPRLTSAQLFDNYKNLLAVQARNGGGSNDGGAGEPPHPESQNEGGLPGQGHPGMIAGSELVPYSSPVSKYAGRYSSLPQSEQIACLAQDLENRSVLYRQAMETVQSGQNLNETLMKENVDLRISSMRDQDIAKKEKARSEEAWKQLETMKLFNSVGVNGVEQRYFLSQKYTDAIQKVKQECEHRLKVLETDRNQLANQNQILNRKITKAAKRNQGYKNRVVKLQKGLVAALSQVVGKFLVNDMSLSNVKLIVKESVTQVCSGMPGDPLKIFNDCFDAWEHEEKLAETICNGLLKGLGKQGPRKAQLEEEDDEEDEFEDVPQPPAKKARIQIQKNQDKSPKSIKTEKPPQENGCVQVNSKVEEKVSAMDEDEDDDGDDFVEVSVPEEFPAFGFDNNSEEISVGLAQPPAPAPPAVQPTAAQIAPDNGKADNLPVDDDAIIERVSNTNATITNFCNQTVVVLERRPELDSIKKAAPIVVKVEPPEEPQQPSQKQTVSVSKDVNVKEKKPFPGRAGVQTRKAVAAVEEKIKTEPIPLKVATKPERPAAKKAEQLLPQLPIEKKAKPVEVKQEVEIVQFQERTGRVRIARAGAVSNVRGGAVSNVRGGAVGNARGGAVSNARGNANIGRGGSNTRGKSSMISHITEKKEPNTGVIGGRGRGRGRGAATTGRGRGVPLNPVRNRLTREFNEPIQPIAKVACEKMRLERQWKEQVEKRREEGQGGKGAAGALAGKKGNQSPVPASQTNQSQQQKPSPTPTKPSSSYKMEDLFGPEEDDNENGKKVPSPRAGAVKDDFDFDGEMVDTDSSTSVDSSSDEDDEVEVSKKEKEQPEVNSKVVKKLEPEVISKVDNVEVKASTTKGNISSVTEKAPPPPSNTYDSLYKDLDLSDTSDDEEEVRNPPQRKAEAEADAKNSSSASATSGESEEEEEDAGDGDSSVAGIHFEKVDFFYSPASPEHHGDAGGLPELPQRVEDNGDARVISKFMQASLDVLLGDPNFLLAFNSVHTIQEVAASAFATIALTTRAQIEEDVVTDERLSKCPLIPRFATLLAIFRDLARLYPVKYRKLPGEFCRLFCKRMVEDNGVEWMENERLLIHVGRFIGAAISLPHAAIDISDVVVTMGGVKGPLLYSFLNGVLMSDSTGVLGYIPKVTSWGNLALWVRAVLVAIYRGPSFSHSFWRGRLVGFLKSLEIQDVVPEELGFDPFFQMLLDEVARIESQRELIKGSKVIAMMMGQKGWIWAKSTIPGLLTQFEGLWKGNRVTDGGFGEGILKGFGLGVAWMRKENLPDNLDDVKTLFARYLDVKFPQIIRDAATSTLDLMDRMVLRQPNQEREYFRYFRKDGGNGREKQPNKKKSAAKRQKQRLARKLKKQQGGGGAGPNAPIRGRGGASATMKPNPGNQKKKPQNNKKGPGAPAQGQGQHPSNGNGASGNKFSFGGGGGGGQWWNKNKPT